MRNIGASAITDYMGQIDEGLKKDAKIVGMYYKKAYEIANELGFSSDVMDQDKFFKTVLEIYYSLRAQESSRLVIESYQTLHNASSALISKKPAGGGGKFN